MLCWVMLSHKVSQQSSPTWNTFKVQASWRFNLQEVFGHSALSCHRATCKLRRCFSVHRSSWLEDQSVSSPSPSPLPPVRLPGLQPRTRLPLPSTGFSSPHHLIPSHPHTHTLKCTVCKSAPRRATHLFSESRLAHPTPPKKQKPFQCLNQPSKMGDWWIWADDKYNTAALINFEKKCVIY